MVLTVPMELEQVQAKLRLDTVKIQLSCSVVEFFQVALLVSVKGEKLEGNNRACVRCLAASATSPFSTHSSGIRGCMSNGRSWIFSSNKALVRP